MSTREATHAGSWYTSSKTELSAELAENLSRVEPIPSLKYEPPILNSKAIIAPHAGYSYSGPCAAWGYASIPTEKINRIILLGPSHHAHLSGTGLALSSFDKYSTPIGDITLDKLVIKQLNDTGLFSTMRKNVDEDEHSLEMHLPYIRYIFQGRDDLLLVPILVGHPSIKTQHEFNNVMARFWNDENTFFVISSDFCHWGTRFDCTPYYPNAPHPPNPVPPVPKNTSSQNQTQPDLELVRRFSTASANPKIPIWQSIRYMDHQAMDILRHPAERGVKEKWEAYLAHTKNTICGRNPITLLLSLVQHIYKDEKDDENKPEFSFVRYEQSSQCVRSSDSSVSYVSGVLRLPH